MLIIYRLFLLGHDLADLTDRHFALLANNQHSMQLDIYESYNKMLRQIHYEGHQSMLTEQDGRLKEVIAERTKYLNYTEGESLSTDDMQDIYI
jgi:hypothetical protein